MKADAEIRSPACLIQHNKLLIDYCDQHTSIVGRAFFIPAPSLNPTEQALRISYPSYQHATYLPPCRHGAEKAIELIKCRPRPRVGIQSLHVT